jgi:hypothetical protein
MCSVNECKKITLLLGLMALCKKPRTSALAGPIPRRIQITLTCPYLLLLGTQNVISCLWGNLFKGKNVLRRIFTKQHINRESCLGSAVPVLGQSVILISCAVKVYLLSWSSIFFSAIFFRY